MSEEKEKKQFKEQAIVLGCIIIAFAIILSKMVTNMGVIDPEQLSNTLIKVNITEPKDQDQTTKALELFFIQFKKFTFLQDNAYIDNLSININSTTNCSVGNYLGLFNPIGNFYFGEILSIVGNTINLDTPLNYNFSKNSNVTCNIRNMNVNGETTTQIFSITAPNKATNKSIDITRIIIKIITETTPDFNKFGDIVGGITKGIVLRQKNEEYYNIFNVKTNGDFVNLAYDYSTFDASNPAQGVYGIGVRLTFAGQEKHGVAIRLNPEDELQLLIQDDLTSLTNFRIVAEGHIVQE